MTGTSCIAEKGWEATSSGTNLLAHASQTGASQGPGPKGAHRSSRQQLSSTGPLVSPALARDSTKPRRIPNVLVPAIGGPGSVTPSSAAANVGIPAPSPNPRYSSATALQQNPQHPQPNAAGTMQDAMRDRIHGHDSTRNFAPPTITHDGENAVSVHDEIPRRSFLASLCRCG